MGPSLKFCAALAVAAVASMPASAQGIVAQKNISLAVAQTIANAALAQCESMGFKVSVTVVDRAGLPLVILRGDGAGRVIRLVSPREGCRLPLIIRFLPLPVDPRQWR